uniref:Ubiquitin-like protease family profile domain-containing protein n=1 Tax=Cucumis melo TaxID=3656 RepID=A0A9I9EBY1_CUCME
MRNILLLIRELVPNLLDSIGFFTRRGRSSTYKEPLSVVIVDSIPLQRNNSDCGVFTIKYFEYIVVGFDLDTLCQENISIMDQHSYVLNFVARFVGVVYHVCCKICIDSSL